MAVPWGSGVFDTVFHLLDSSQTLLAYNDDDPMYPNAVHSVIDYYVSPGDYYIILDGTDKLGHDNNSGVNIEFTLSQ